MIPFLTRWVLFLSVVILAVSCTPAATAPTPVPNNRAWTPQRRDHNGVIMVRVPAGCFTMGSADGRRDERPPHRQCLRAFWIDATEVTNAHYGSEGAYPGPQRPRENLTWAEARDFCRKRGGRLPTEVEWEYAARGPDNLIYPWGNVMIDQFVHLDKRSSKTTDVGSYPAGASWVGALDMSGNVWEWVSSLYRPYPYAAADGREDEADATNPRVFRGGWLSYHDRGTSAVMRFRMNPAERDWRVGFRCASDAP